MSEHPVADLRARQLAGAHAAAQYRRSAMLHESEAIQRMTRGWFTWAGESLWRAERLRLAAQAEEMP
jgi:hypothetical protein